MKSHRQIPQPSISGLGKRLRPAADGALGDHLQSMGRLLSVRRPVGTALGKRGIYAPSVAGWLKRRVATALRPMACWQYPNQSGRYATPGPNEGRGPGPEAPRLTSTVATRRNVTAAWQRHGKMSSQRDQYFCVPGSSRRLRSEQQRTTN